MAQQKQIPVYLFTGFLSGGKTTFIRSTLEDKRFNDGTENILLILCEEGEEEYDADAFGKNVFMRSIEDENDLNEDALSAWLKETGSDKVMIEYNGMWEMQSLYEVIPEGWLIGQQFFFAEGPTFQVFNANMRTQCYDKLRTCDVMVFNRCREDTDTDILHKIVRQANRRCGIFYDYTDGRSIADQKEDPLPFDKEAPVIKVEDRDYAYFFADLMENTKDYKGKTAEFVATFPKTDKKLPAGVIVAGRMLMNCCAADTQLAAMACYLGKHEMPAPDTWFRIRGRIRLQRNHLFGGEVPVMDVLGISPASEPDDPVATFY